MKKTKNKTKDSYVFFSFCEVVGFQKKKEKKKREGKKLVQKKILYIIKSWCVIIIIIIFHLSADVAILTTQI